MPPAVRAIPQASPEGRSAETVPLDPLAVAVGQAEAGAAAECQPAAPDANRPRRPGSLPSNSSQRDTLPYNRIISVHRGGGLNCKGTLAERGRLQRPPGASSGPPGSPRIRRPCQPIEVRAGYRPPGPQRRSPAWAGLLPSSAKSH